MLWIGGRRRGVGRMWSLSRSERCVFLRERERIEVWCGGGGGGDGKANDECINKND